MSSCYTANKATRQVWKAQGFHPEVVANICADLYTSPDSVFANEVLLKGDTTIVTDTFSETDTVLKTVYKYIYSTQHTTDTLLRNKYIQVNNRAAEKAFQNKLTAAGNKLASEMRAVKLWRLAAIIAITIIAVYTALRIWL